MDLSKTGKFIAERRKEKGLTQVKLAEKLNVSEKTISKWECGNGFPDTTLILPLCEILEISSNELLSAKLLPTISLKPEVTVTSSLYLNCPNTAPSTVTVYSVSSFVCFVCFAWKQGIYIQSMSMLEAGTPVCYNNVTFANMKKG